MRVLEAADVAAWARDVLLNPRREKPIVAVTTRPRTGGSWLDPKELASTLAGLADVVCLETGDPTWELAEALPARLDVYGGAVRIWWPGLKPSSDPYDHRLFIIHSAAQAREVFEELVRGVRGAAHAPAPAGPDPVELRVESIAGTRVELVGDACHGELRHSDVPLAELVRSLAPGTPIRAKVERALPDGRVEFSSRGLLPSPWRVAEDALRVGDVVLGRVQSTKDFGAFIEVLPQVTGLAHVSELDWTFVDSVSDFVIPGQVLPVKVMAMNAEEHKLELSVKRALGSHPIPLPPLVPGGVAFTWSADDARDAPAESAQELEQRASSLGDELDAAVADRAHLAEANKQLREQVQELRKELRSAEDRFAGLERRLAPELDPLGSERGFLLGVRLAYARSFDEGDRRRNPLRKMRVGSAFLESLRTLDGIDHSKVLEVCAQVAADAAHELASREVHQLHDGSRGSGPRVRASDQAQAWRCSLQVRTPSARRLHWWRVPGEDGPTIEFAAVGLHDDFAIPE
jgi:hypothetical protein